MTTEQVSLFGLLFFVFVFLIWGRWRYDLVAFVALLVALLTGLVPKEQAFSGFGHPATVIIALVLIVSRGLSNSGVIELLARHVVDASRKLASHVAIMSGLAAHAVGFAGSKKEQAKSFAVIDAVVVRVDPRRHDHSDRYAAKHHHCGISRNGAR